MPSSLVSQTGYFITGVPEVEMAGATTITSLMVWLSFAVVSLSFCSVVIKLFQLTDELLTARDFDVWFGRVFKLRTPVIDSSQA